MAMRWYGVYSFELRNAAGNGILESMNAVNIVKYNLMLKKLDSLLVIYE
jgi:hypothetical protein